MADVKNGSNIAIPGYLRLSKIVVWFLYFWIIIGIASLAMRVFLLAFSANMSAGFSEFVANVSSDYLAPFRGIFPAKTIGQTGYLDISALFAILVYLFIAWGIAALIGYVQNKIDSAVYEQEKEIDNNNKVKLAKIKSSSKA